VAATPTSPVPCRFWRSFHPVRPPPGGPGSTRPGVSATPWLPTWKAMTPAPTCRPATSGSRPTSRRSTQVPCPPPSAHSPVHQVAKIYRHPTSWTCPNRNREKQPVSVPPTRSTQSLRLLWTPASRMSTIPGPPTSTTPELRMFALFRPCPRVPPTPRRGPPGGGGPRSLVHLAKTSDPPHLDRSPKTVPAGGLRPPSEVHPRCGPPPTVHTPRSDDRFSGFAEKQTSLSDDSTPENLLSCVCPPPGSFLCSRRSPNRKPPMRLIPSTPLAPLGAAVAAVVLLSGCEGSDFDFDFDLDTDFFSSDSEESPDPSADPSPGEEGEEEEQASNHG